MSDLRPALSSALDAFGLAASVTVPGGAAVSTTVFWLPPDTVRTPTGSKQQRAEPLRVLVIPLAGLSSIPRATAIAVAPYSGASSADWVVDEVAEVEDDHYRVTVVPA